MTLQTIGLKRRSTQALQARRPGDVRLPDVLDASARDTSSPVPKTLSTRHGPLELISEKFSVSGSSAVMVKLGKRPLRKRKSRKQFQDLKIGDLRQCIWKLDEDDRLRRKKSHIEQRKSSVWEKQEGMGMVSLPGFETRDYMNTLLTGRLGHGLYDLSQDNIAGGQRQAETDKFLVLPPLIDAPKPVLVTRDTEFKSGEQDAGQQLGSTDEGHSFRMSTIGIQQGLEVPVNSPVIDQTVAEKYKQLPPIDTKLASTRQDKSTFLSSGHILFQPWEVADHVSSKHRLLPPISQPVKKSRSVSPTRPPSQQNCTTPVIDLNVQFAHTDRSRHPHVTDGLRAAQDLNIPPQRGVVPLLPSVGGRSLKAMKPMHLHESGRSSHGPSKQTIFLVTDYIYV